MESERPPTDRTGTIGIIGAGHIGQALARTALRAGREVVIANSRGPESLAPVVAALGAGVSAGTDREAVAAGIVAIAVPWTNVPAAVTGLHWDGQTVIDALSHEHAQRYHEQVAQGRRLVSVTVTTDAEDEEARSLMVDIGADEISSAADGTMHVVHRAPPPGAVPPNA
jgi:predicted dinucleotide-binding enzyme